jgi:hypothetical protein
MIGDMLMVLRSIILPLGIIIVTFVVMAVIEWWGRRNERRCRHCGTGSAQCFTRYITRLQCCCDGCATLGGGKSHGVKW